MCTANVCNALEKFSTIFSAFLVTIKNVLLQTVVTSSIELFIKSFVSNPVWNFYDTLSLLIKHYYDGLQHVEKVFNKIIIQAIT